MQNGWSSYRTLLSALIAVGIILIPALLRKLGVDESTIASVTQYTAPGGPIVGLLGLGWFSTDEQAAKDAGLPLK